MERTKVAIANGPKKPNENQIEANVRKAIGLVGGLDGIKSGDIVILDLEDEDEAKRYVKDRFVTVRA